MLGWAKAAKGQSQDFTTATDQVGSWMAGGARRLNLDSDTANEDNGEALVIFDTWFNDLVHKVFDDELGTDAYQFMPTPLSDYKPAGGTSFYFGFQDYLADLFSKSAAARYSLDYCDNRATKKHETCTKDVVGALKQALKDISAKQGTDMSKWTTPAENIVFREFGGGSVPDIPWQNRGTHNQLVEILAKASPQPAPSPPSTSPTP
jgi:acyl-homoserine lactone acylase PvdQ